MTRNYRLYLALTALLAAAVALVAFFAFFKLGQAGANLRAAREANFQSYRLANHLQAQVVGYELAMNEYYSTVIDRPRYQEKAAELRLAIDADLQKLLGQEAGDSGPMAGTLKRLVLEMDTFRISLEKAMTGNAPDWEVAREALFKVNILSAQTIQQAALLAERTAKEATALDAAWQSRQAEAQSLAASAAAGAALLAGLAVLGWLGVCRACGLCRA